MQSVAQKDILKVKELCDILGFRAASSRPHNLLTDSTHVWRRQYLTKDGIRGKDLREWKSLRVRTALYDMAAAFLEEGDYGERFWPAEGYQSPRDVPEHPKDSHMCVFQKF